MNSKILKLAGVKTEKEFYKKFPTKKDFMAKCGAKLRKAEWGEAIWKNMNNAQNSYYKSLINPKNPWIGQSKTKNSPYTSLLEQDTDDPLTIEPWMTETETFDDPSKKGGGMLEGILGGINPANKLIKGVQHLIEERDEMRKADQWNQVSNLTLQASQVKEDIPERRYVRPEDTTMGLEQFNNPTGVGTNILAKNGKKVVRKKKAGNGADILSAFSNPTSNYISEAFDHNAGAELGSALGDTLNVIPGVGPIVSGIAKPVLTAIGGAVDPYAKKIKKYRGQMNRNIDNMSLNSGIKGVQKQYSSFMEDGGELLPSITRFTEPIEQELMPVPSKFSSTKRFRKNGPTYLEESQRIDSELDKATKNKDRVKMVELNKLKTDLMTHQLGGKFKDGGKLKYQMGGDLELYDGSAEVISENPFLPDEGQTVKFRGPSHKNGGMDIAYGDNPVEVEGDETAVKLSDGGGVDNLVVFGNIPITKDIAPLIGDEKAVGKKFKNYIADLSKEEEKSNKLIEKTTGQIQELEVTDSFDKLEMETHRLNLEGAQSKLKDIANKKQKASDVQESINKVADENGLDPSSLVRGKIKKAKNGATMKAATGKIVGGVDITKWATAPHHEEAIDSVYNKISEEVDLSDIDAINDYIQSTAKGDTKVTAEMVQQSADKHGIDPALIMAIMEVDSHYGTTGKGARTNNPGNWNTTDSGNVHAFDTIEEGVDKIAWQLNRYPKSESKSEKTAESKPSSAPSRESMTDKSKSIGKNYYNQFNDSGEEYEKIDRPQTDLEIIDEMETSPANLPDLPKDPVYRSTLARILGIPAEEGYDPKTRSVGNWFARNSTPALWSKWDRGSGPIIPPGLDFSDLTKEGLQYGEFDRGDPLPHMMGTPPDVIDLESERMADAKLKDYKPKMSNERAKRNLWEESTPRLNNEMTFPDITYPEFPDYSPVLDEEVDEVGNNFNWMDVVNTALPYFRPSDAEDLDPRQLSGELLALSQNQLEPVYAQTYSPDLSTPYDVSYQDILNENESDYRATQRLAGYNPAVQSILNAQKYKANQKVLGEQFRVNQAVKDKVYGENRAALNDAKLRNLQILDQQQVRQSQAKSATKDTKQAAISSISDKFLKNTLENRTLGVHENLYNYRFDNKGRAYNMNPLAKFNIPEVGSSSYGRGDYQPLPDDREYLYDEEGRPATIRKRSGSTSSSNGSIVRATKMG